MSKKGQITTFIIIGIVILAIVAVVLYFRQAELGQLPREAVSPEVQPVQFFVEECIQRTAVPGIYQLGAQGGYINPPADAYYTTSFPISYGFSNQNNALPTIDQMQNELSGYMMQMLPLCTRHFEDFKNRGMDIEEGNISVETRIFKDDVTFIVDYPLRILVGGSESRMQNFIANVPVKLGDDYSIASKIVQENQNSFNLNSMIFSSSPGVTVNLIPSSADTLILGVRDERIVIENRTFVFMFAYEIDRNKKPQLGDFTIPVFESGKEAYFAADAIDPDGDKITYSTNSTEFRINPDTGEIKTIAPAAGTYMVKITAEDGKGGSDEEIVPFRVL